MNRKNSLVVRVSCSIISITVILFSLNSWSIGGSALKHFWDVITPPKCTFRCLAIPPAPVPQVITREELIKIIENDDPSHVYSPQKLFSQIKQGMFFLDDLPFISEKEISFNRAANIFADSYKIFRQNKINKEDALKLANNFGSSDYNQLLQEIFGEELDIYKKLYEASEYKKYSSWQIEHSIKVKGRVSEQTAEFCHKQELKTLLKSELEKLGEKTSDKIRWYASKYYSQYMILVESHIKKEFEETIKVLFYRFIRKLLPYTKDYPIEWIIENISIDNNTATVNVSSVCGYQISFDITGYDWFGLSKDTKTSFKIVVTPEGVPLIAPYLNRYVRDTID